MSEANRILVVDDDSDTRWMLCRYLSKHAYDVRAVEDGEQMRQALEERGVVLDLSLPGEDGLTLARAKEDRGQPREARDTEDDSWHRLHFCLGSLVSCPVIAPETPL